MRRDESHLGFVFVASVVLSVGFVAAGLIVPGPLADALSTAQEWVVDTFGTVYVVTVFAILVLMLALAVLPVGRIRLGADGVRPEFGWLSWVAMLMSAGVGLSFLFWGVAEPLIHYADPPPGTAPPGSEGAAESGLRYSLLFWGPHAWALYAAVAIPVAYAAFRHGRPVLISSALHPILGKRTNGLIGNLVDLIAVFAILFGVATSLGLGSHELNAGLGYAFGWPDSYGIKIAIIAGLMTVSTISAMTGLGRGIRILSLVNVALCGVLLCFVLVMGPTSHLFGAFGDTVRGYTTNFATMTFATETPGTGWESEWTYFFWAWWISWAPFVGTFIARISRGRTIRSVVVAVVLVPSAVSAVWFSILGGTSLQRETSGAVDIANVAGQMKSVATVEVLGTLPLDVFVAATVISVLALLFVTSADSASFMLGSTTSGGGMKPPRPLRLLWAFAAAFASVLLLDEGTQSLHGAAVVAAVPFTVILIGLSVSLVVSLWRDTRKRVGTREAPDP